MTDPRASHAASALLLALLLVGGAGPELSAAQDKPASPPAKAAPSKPPAASASAPGRASPEPEPDLRVGAGVAFGLLDLPNLGTSIIVLAQLESLAVPLELGASYGFNNAHELTPSELDLGANPYFIYPFPPDGSRLVFRQLRAQLAACPVEHPLSNGTVRLCGGAHLAWLTADAEGLAEVSAQDSVIFGLDLHARFRFALTGPLSLTYAAGLSIPFVRDEFGLVDPYQRYRELFRASPVTARIDLLLTVAL